MRITTRSRIVVQACAVVAVAFGLLAACRADAQPQTCDLTVDASIPFFTAQGIALPLSLPYSFEIVFFDSKSSAGLIVHSIELDLDCVPDGAGFCQCVEERPPDSCPEREDLGEFVEFRGNISQANCQGPDGNPVTWVANHENPPSTNPNTLVLTAEAVGGGHPDGVLVTSDASRDAGCTVSFELQVKGQPPRAEIIVPTATFYTCPTQIPPVPKFDPDALHYQLCAGGSDVFVLPTADEFEKPEYLRSLQTALNLEVVPGTVSYIGTSLAAGTFVSEFRSKLGLSRGVVITTGNSQCAPGPNSSGRSSLAGQPAGDQDLDAVFHVPTQDAASLSFEFDHPGGDLSIPYVFGSDEYPEFVDVSPDAFGILLNVAGEFENLAVVRGSAENVGVGTINPNANRDLYRSNANGDISVEYDGLSVVLAAIKEDLPPGRYGLKIAIADTLDQVIDSAVFIPEPRAGLSETIALVGLIVLSSVRWNSGTRGSRSR